MTHRVWLIVAVLGVGMMAAFTLVVTPPPLMSPDSDGYLGWHPYRTPGYPLVLALIGALDPSFAILPYVQMALLIGTTAFLAQAGARLGGPWWVWVLMGLGAAGNPFLWRFAWQMQTEALFITMGTAFLACIGMALRHRPAGLGWLIGASLCLGAAILIRPVGYALLGVAPLVAVVWRGGRLRAALAATVPALVMLLAVSSWNLATKGFFATQIFGGYNIVGQVAVLVEPEMEFDTPEAAAAARRIADELAHVRAQLRMDPAEWKTFYWMTTYAYNLALRRHALPAIDDAIEKSGSKPSSPVESIRQANALAWRIALSAIAQQPLSYVQLVAVHFVGLWTLPDVASPETTAAVRRLLCAESFKQFYCASDQLDVLQVHVPAPVAAIKDAVLATLMLGSFLLIVVVALWQGAPAVLAFGAIAALCVNANHLLVALVEAGLPRYALAAWPAQMAMCAAVAAWLLARRRRSRA